MEMELRQTKEAISIVEKANKELEVKLSESSESNTKLETELKEWQCKYAKAIADMGADPVDAQVEEAPKTFQERLDACKTYSEKHKFLNENMAELQQNWNKLI
jgi:prefoldin subunit 5